MHFSIVKNCQVQSQNRTGAIYLERMYPVSCQLHHFLYAFILWALLTQAEKVEKLEEAEVIKGISPIAWRYVNLLGRFEFQRPQNPINIDELIKAFEQKIVWQM